MLKADYHFHPNLQKNDEEAIKTCEKHWNKFLKKKINCVIITEHAYKNPKRAYELMLKTKPKQNHCIPGMEYITKEGIDIVIFSKTKKIYEIKKLKPFKLTLNELLKYLHENKKLYSFITHPYTLGTTSIIDHVNHKEYTKAVNYLGAVEVSNGSFDNLIKILRKYLFKKLLKKELKRAKKTQHLPKKDYPKKIKFLAVGSDAHVTSDIGRCTEINENKKGVFDSLITNKKTKIHANHNNFNMTKLIRTGIITFKEYIIKKEIKLGMKK